MSNGIEFDFRPRLLDKGVFLHVCPPFVASGQMIVGSFKEPGFSGPIVAFMHDYYSVSSEQQRLMAENTVALCYLKYEQEVANA